MIHITHPDFKNFTHNVIWNIQAPKDISREIPQGKNVGTLNNAIQGIAYGWHKYAGPKPPKGRKHQYRFTVYVLDHVLVLSPNATKRRFIKAAKHHILQQGTVIGLFG